MQVFVAREAITVTQRAAVMRPIDFIDAERNFATGRTPSAFLEVTGSRIRDEIISLVEVGRLGSSISFAMRVAHNSAFYPDRTA
jgi:hypothetical protein